MRKRIFGSICVVAVALLFSIGVYAATPVDNDNHTDTADYCLRAKDVQIGYTELGKYATDEERYEAILKASTPVILIRGDDETLSEHWIKLERTQYTVDFQNIKWSENTSGYSVTVTAPPIFMGQPSYITFHVYIVDDLSKPVFATVQFFGTELSDLEMDITNGATLSYNDLMIPQKEGFVFAGWYLDVDCTKSFLLPDNEGYAKQEVVGDLVLYPKWDKILPNVPSAEPDIESKETSLSTNISSKSRITHPLIVRSKLPLVEVHPTPPEAEQMEVTPESLKERPEENSEMVDSQTFSKSKERAGGGITIMEMISLLAGSFVALSFRGSIASDLKVLGWYAKKKKARLMS